MTFPNQNTTLYEYKIPLYMAGLYFFINKTNASSYTSKEILNFLIKYKNDKFIKFILKNKEPNEFIRNKLGYVNRLNILKDGVYEIPIECFILLQQSFISYDNNFVLFFDSKENYLLFKKWKNIERLNDFIYHSDKGLLKQVINTAINSGLIEEILDENKIKISYNVRKKSGTLTQNKQYKYNDISDGLITLINEKYYIDIYDIYNQTHTKFYNKEECIINIIQKIDKNLLIQKMKQHNIFINKKLLEIKIKEFLFQGY